MAVYHPSTLSTKLARLFEAGYSDVARFASECDLPPHFVQDVWKKPGIRLNRDIENRIGRVLSQYLRQYPELYRIMDAPPPTKRRVEEIELRARDWRGFEVWNSQGECMLYVEKPRARVTQAFIDGLWRYLDREDPLPNLRIIG